MIAMEDVGLVYSSSTLIPWTRNDRFACGRIFVRMMLKLNSKWVISLTSRIRTGTAMIAVLAAKRDRNKRILRR
jgi:hypothetical protein